MTSEQVFRLTRAIVSNAAPDVEGLVLVLMTARDDGRMQVESIVSVTGDLTRERALAAAILSLEERRIERVNVYRGSPPAPPESACEN